MTIQVKRNKKICFSWRLCRRIYLKLRYYFILWQLNLDLKSVSEDVCLRSVGKQFHN